MNELYNKIHDLCEKRQISIAQMCRGSGVSQQNMTELKKGRTACLSAKNIDKVANYFGVTVSYLLGTENSPSVDEELNEYLELLRIRPEMKMLFHTFSGASKEEIEAIVLAWEARNNIK